MHYACIIRLSMPDLRLFIRLLCINKIKSRLAKSENSKKIAAHPKQSVRLNKNVLFSLLSAERSISVRTQKFVSFVYGLSNKSCNTEFQSIILIGVLKGMSSQLKEFICCI